MTLTAAEVYAAKVDAALAQRARLVRETVADEDRWARRASFFRLDPRRELEANTRAIIDLITPLDTVIDIGGGAGRIALPAALKCTEVINVEPSAAMRREFEESAREAGIDNARCVAGQWPAVAGGLDADVVMTSNVTYFVRDILPFLEAMDRAAERLCIITVWSVPPPDRIADIYQVVHGEELCRAPTHLDLLGALWELGILPDVRVLPDRFRAFRRTFETRDEAIEEALALVEATGIESARQSIERAFWDLFSEDEQERIVASWLPDPRELLITWTPRGAAETDRNGAA